jgi:hypothetical protein
MFRQYTKCYQHTPGDKPFNKSDLAAFVAGASAPGLIGAILAFLSGMYWLGFVLIAVQYANTIIAVANEWLYHRLVCLTGDQRAVGTVASGPTRSDLGEFDNDEFFDLRLLPHRPGDAYKSPDNNVSSGQPGPSQDGKTELHAENDIYLDVFRNLPALDPSPGQGQALLKPSPLVSDLSYDLTRSALHCEAEGNFWQAMKDYAAVMGVAVGVGTAAGAGVGAAAGCAIGGFFGPLGCLIGAIIGAIIGGLAGGAAAAAIGANSAFNSNPGDVEDANVGDKALGPIADGDKVIVFGTHVYDGFHEGWHEIHPLKAVMKLNSDESSPYLEWDPGFPDNGTLPGDTADMPSSIQNVSADDMRQGLSSAKFAARAQWLRDKWCGLVREAFDPGTRTAQDLPPNRWTIHPLIDSCTPPGNGTPPIH